MSDKQCRQVVGLASRRGRLRWLIPGGFFSLFLVPSAVQHVTEAGSLPRAVLIGAVFGGYGAAYLVAPPLLWPRPVWVKIVGSVAHLALGFGLLALFGQDSLILMIYAMGVAAVMLPVPWAVLVDGAVLAALVGWTLATDTLAVHGGELVTLLSVSVSLVFMGELVRTVVELRAARDEVARLAVAEERARFARDLHDVLGHSLTTITVKAGLVRRLLEAGADRERAAAEVREVEQLARQALTEVRATVSGYREASLVAEVAGARAALRAAGVEPVLPHAVDDVPAALQPVFGYVLREGVTNVLRHSGATRCEVRLGRTWLEIRDNGPGGTSTVDSLGAGHGLEGLRERLAAVGGTLEAGRLPAGGFRLRASVPPAAEREAAPAAEPRLGLA
ncbi:sensor histidine kinase [Gandjariella thermophila]|uniref:sensor histidine kinase n=1 Tax=Gandjariella thermophila TaxID=1931992 RepID=UPI0010FA0EA1|nr:sensor histidine kinase [Gandjariella thermophila]